MAKKKSNSIPFWRRKEVWGAALTALSFAPELLSAMGETGLLKKHTVAFKIATPLGIILTLFGLRKGYQSNNLQLPGGIGDVSNVIDKLPENELFGTRGELTP